MNDKLPIAALDPRLVDLFVENFQAFRDCLGIIANEIGTLNKDLILNSVPDLRSFQQETLNF